MILKLYNPICVIIYSKPPKAPSKLPKKPSASSLVTVDTAVENPTHFRPIGKLKAHNSDGTQVIEMMKPPHGPYGFYIARGNAKYNHGQ